MNSVLHGSAADASMLTPNFSEFGYMFSQIQKCGPDDDFLPKGDDTIVCLIELGRSMVNKNSKDESTKIPEGESTIPAIFTYFGQFIDHDITRTIDKADPNGDEIKAERFDPLSEEDIKGFVNCRTGFLDLDSVYGSPAAREEDGTMSLSCVTPTMQSIEVDDQLHDLPRLCPITKNNNSKTLSGEQKKADRKALIGDERNDENLIISQLHVAFLRAHNAIMKSSPDTTCKDAEAQLRRLYQAAVRFDFLEIICDEKIVNDVFECKCHDDLIAQLTYDDGTEKKMVIMPLEFSTAAFRFGHSMVRQKYDFNDNFTGEDAIDFSQLFTYTALSGDISPNEGFDQTFPTLPDNLIIDWDRFVPKSSKTRTKNLARKIDTQLALELSKLRDIQGITFSNLESETLTDHQKEIMSELAIRNLLRGYHHHLPTGQAIANKLKKDPLGRSEFKNILRNQPKVFEALNNGGMLHRTPLWFYILAEASHASDGNRLGEVGSIIVATTFKALLQNSADNILTNPLQDDEFSDLNGQVISVKILKEKGFLRHIIDLSRLAQN